MVWGQFEKQIARGVQGFGLFDGNVIFKTPKQKKIRGYLRNSKHQSDFLMFHHRMPTSTVNCKRAAHPFSSGDYFYIKYKNGKVKQRVKYVLVHNGHIQNSNKLKLEHETLGIEYSSVLENGTFNDSESLMWDVALYLEGKQDALKAYGGMAFVVAKVVDDEITHLYFGKNPGRPLKLYREKDGILLSSEGPGEGIDDHRLYTYNYKLNRLTNKYLRIPSYDPESYAYTWNTGNSYTPPARTPVSTTYSPPTWAYREADSHAPVDDSNYYIDDDGEIVFFDNEDWETRPLNNYPRVTDRQNLAGKTKDDLYVEEYDQRWFLSKYGKGTDKDVRLWSVYADYMQKAAGVYEQAYNLMEFDFNYYSNHAKNATRDLIIDILEQAMALTYTQVGYKDASSVDEFYVKPAEPAPSATIFTQPQLLGARQEG